MQDISPILRFWLVLAGFGWFWQVLAGFGWFWLVLVGFGWGQVALFWSVLPVWVGFGWFLLVFAFYHDSKKQKPAKTGQNQPELTTIFSKLITLVVFLA